MQRCSTQGASGTNPLSTKLAGASKRVWWLGGVLQNRASKIYSKCRLWYDSEDQLVARPALRTGAQLYSECLLKSEYMFESSGPSSDWSILLKQTARCHTKSGSGVSIVHGARRNQPIRIAHVLSQDDHLYDRPIHHWSSQGRS